MEASLPGTQHTKGNQGESCGTGTKTHQLPIERHHLSQGGSQLINGYHGITLGIWTSVVNHQCHTAVLITSCKDLLMKH